jgi:hypothetical protein
MVAMVLTVYDGLLSLIFQPFMGALFSGVFVGLALLVGLILRAPKIRDIWRSAGWWVLVITAASLAVMVFHAPFGLQDELVNPETKQKIVTMSPLAGVICYFLAIFPIVNFPQKKEIASSKS